MRLLENQNLGDEVQLTFSTKPNISPLFLAARAKGRLQHAFRSHGDKGAAFKRKLSVRSIGNNVRSQVEEYICNQVQAANFCDPRFTDALESLRYFDLQIDLSKPSFSSRGCYWYNLHLVLEIIDHERIRDLEKLAEICGSFQRIARAKGHGLAHLSPMPNHFHAALRGEFTQSPEEIALAYLNNIAYIMGQKAIWQPGYYAGTFSEYDMGAVRPQL